MGPISSWDYVSVRWTGKLLAPSTEIFTFTLNASDSFSLWIDGEFLLCCGSMNVQYQLTAGKYHEILVEFVEYGSWSWI